MNICDCKTNIYTLCFHIIMEEWNIIQVITNFRDKRNIQLTEL